VSVWTSTTTKTVVFLGAGASRASDKNLPTMDGFFGTAPESLSGSLRHFLGWFYGHEDVARYNVEEVLSYLDLAAARVPKWTGRASVRAMGPRTFKYEDLMEYVAIRLAIRGTPCAQHRRLVERLQPADTILTLNYDLVCDQVLRDLESSHDVSVVGSRLSKLRGLLGRGELFWGEEPVTLLPSETATGFYLKLHGSLDWLYCPNEQCPNAARYYALTIEQGVGGQEAGQPCRRCGNLLRVFMVPPVSTKVLAHEGKLAFLWNLALRELAQAARIVVIGVSFAPTDYELRWLVRQGNAFRRTAAHLDVVNPSKDHRLAAMNLCASAVTEVRQFGALEDYLEDRQLS
jgi:hypothetical protein